MTHQRLFNISQTPLVFNLGFAQRHQEVLLPCLLLIRRALALSCLLLLLLLSMRTVVRLAVCACKSDLLFFGVLFANLCGKLDGIGRDGFIGVAGGEELGAFGGGEGGGYC